jgi:hypothetical protein
MGSSHASEGQGWLLVHKGDRFKETHSSLDMFDPDSYRTETIKNLWPRNFCGDQGQDKILIEDKQDLITFFTQLSKLANEEEFDISPVLANLESCHVQEFTFNVVTEWSVTRALIRKIYCHQEVQQGEVVRFPEPVDLEASVPQECPLFTLPVEMLKVIFPPGLIKSPPWLSRSSWVREGMHVYDDF